MIYLTVSRLLQRTTKRHSPLPLLRIAVFLAVGLSLFQPLFHHHPLAGTPGESSLAPQNVCAVCAVGTDHLVLTAAPFVAPAIDTHPLDAVIFASPAAGVTPALAARGPPSC
jgi:hypothetical protein